MIGKPPYFDEIHRKSAQRWDQLERDPDLAGPWHQLFKQVQSPRHVLSELLQNADDAGATEASVKISNGEFTFAHNGEDFVAEHFASLCRFGYSNKRALHTIGFRGIGFKSTFSLGEEVRLVTPTLSVAFRRARFTEPIWVNDERRDQTEVRVLIRDKHRQLELEKNLSDWLKSPVSLLFFRHIRCLRVGHDEVRWTLVGPGPISNSEWMALSTDADKKYLLIRSVEEAFPPDCLDEIRQERMIAFEEETVFPPCRVEIVLGLEGRLFVILPTGVKTKLPFACNAPFIQDPARVKIKDPETSPTNRWLLERAGKLASKTMLAWLNNVNLSIEERCGAYELLSDVDREDSSLEGACAATVEHSIHDSIENEAFLLNDDGVLERSQKCTAVPTTLLEVWSADQVSGFFCKDKRRVLCNALSGESRTKLVHWGCVDELTKPEILSILQSQHLPKPSSWRQLMALWAYLKREITENYVHDYSTAKIVPVQGKDVLFAASDVVRLGEKKLLVSAEDWEFLSRFQIVLNHNWPRFLAEQRRKAQDDSDDRLRNVVESAYGVLEKLDLAEASDVDRVIEQVADSIFDADECVTEDCVRLAQLAAKLGANVSGNFHFVTQDNTLMPVGKQIVADLNGDFDTFVDNEWRIEHALHSDYSKRFESCSKSEWRQWIASGRSSLLTFVPLNQKRIEFCRRFDLQKELRQRGFDQELTFPYARDIFVLEDWDFDNCHWQFWQLLAGDEEGFWARLLNRILLQPQVDLLKTISARPLQIGNNKTGRLLSQDPVVSGWINEFRNLPCLQDTRGQFRLPAELLRRTPETESLLDVEPFVRAELDIEANRPLLILLGVRDTPTGPDRLLDRLRTLATVQNPPVHEVEKWYYRLDQLLTKCSTAEFLTIEHAFESERIILTQDRTWARAREVFLNADEEDVPGASVIHSPVKHLSMWPKVGVADRPTAELAIGWLKSLLSGDALAADEVRRVRSLLPRYPERIWNECGHWLNLEGEWAPVETLAYALTMQTLVPWKHLFRPIKQRTADFQKLSAEFCAHRPFSVLPSLASSIEDRFEHQLNGVASPRNEPWLKALGEGLSRIIVDLQDDNERIRELGRRLARTICQIVTDLQTVPYLANTPAGAERRIEVLWKEAILYLQNRSTAKMAKAVAQELGREFARPDITDAIMLCYDRPPEFVAEYLEANFTLLPADAVELDLTSAAADGNGALPTPDGDGTRQDSDQTRGATTNGNGPVVDANPNSDVQADHAAEQPSNESQHPEPEQNPSRPKLARPEKPSLVERFAFVNGFKKEGSPDRFFHSDGSWLEKVSGNSFPWERFAANGELVQCYWPKEHCLQLSPLQLDAEVWTLCGKYPAKYSLLLVGVDDSPIVISGQQLRKMSDSAQIVLFPATYRLVYKHEHDS